MSAASSSSPPPLPVRRVSSMGPRSVRSATSSQRSKGSRLQQRLRSVSPFAGCAPTSSSSSSLSPSQQLLQEEQREQQEEEEEQERLARQQEEEAAVAAAAAAASARELEIAERQVAKVSARAALLRRRVEQGIQGLSARREELQRGLGMIQQAQTEFLGMLMLVLFIEYYLFVGHVVLGIGAVVTMIGLVNRRAYGIWEAQEKALARIEAMEAAARAAFLAEMAAATEEGSTGTVATKQIQEMAVNGGADLTTVLSSGSRLHEARKLISTFGNGRNEELGDDEVLLIIRLKEAATQFLKEKEIDPGVREALDAWCDLDTCRRYLVARSWSFKKAQEQLVKSLQWRIDENPTRIRFEESPKCLDNPWALSMRVTGLDKDGRPVIYTCFSQANDRFDLEGNMTHLQALLEEAHAMIKRRASMGLNVAANTKQWVWVIDFHGFGIRDQNPASALQTARLMANYPEMLHMCVLIDSPFLFSATWNLVSSALDDRVRAKISFVAENTIEKKLIDRIGEDAVAWLRAEMADNRIRRPKESPKCYWEPPAAATAAAEAPHDPRGMAGYVDSEWYIRTPGDNWKQKQQQQQQTS